MSAAVNRIRIGAEAHLAGGIPRGSGDGRLERVRTQSGPLWALVDGGVARIRWPEPRGFPRFGTHDCWPPVGTAGRNEKPVGEEPSRRPAHRPFSPTLVVHSRAVEGHIGTTAEALATTAPGRPKVPRTSGTARRNPASMAREERAGVYRTPNLLWRCPGRAFGLGDGICRVLAVAFVRKGICCRFSAVWRRDRTTMILPRKPRWPRARGNASGRGGHRRRRDEAQNTARIRTVEETGGHRVTPSS